jgi:hypothetical protein
MILPQGMGKMEEGELSGGDETLVITDLKLSSAEFDTALDYFSSDR